MQAIRPINTSRVPKPNAQRPSLFLDEAPLSPLDIEIGCGVGLHPIQYAQANPNRKLIAIEHTREKFEKFERRIQNHPSMPNLLPVHANAISWVTHLIEANSVSRYFILYPNPNPKPKHANLRWHRMSFFGELISTLLPGGTIEIATNESFYIQEAQHYISEFWKLSDIHVRELSAQTDRPRTHFERKFFSQNVPCYKLTATKAAKSNRSPKQSLRHRPSGA